MEQTFGEQIAEHRKQFVMMDHPLAQKPAKQELESEQAQKQELDLMRYQTAFGDLN